jgi:hypothetical protein
MSDEENEDDISGEEDLNEQPNEQEPDDESLDELSEYKTTPEEATKQERPGIFNRKKVLMTLTVIFVVVVGGGLLGNIVKKQKTSADETYGDSASLQSPDFLRGGLDRSLIAQQNKPDDLTSTAPEETAPAGLPAVSWNDNRNVPPPPQQQQTPPPPPPQGYGGAPEQQQQNYYASSLLPHIEGRLNTDPPTVAQTTPGRGNQTQSSMDI